MPASRVDLHRVTRLLDDPRDEIDVAPLCAADRTRSLGCGNNIDRSLAVGQVGSLQCQGLARCIQFCASADGDDGLIADMTNHQPFQNGNL